RKQLEEWVASKGKKYKRPPMSQLWKQGVQPSHRKAKAQEKQENPKQRSQAAISTILTDCLKCTEENVDAEEVSAVLSLVPQAEKFAKFWVCQAKLMAHSVTFDVLELYKGAVIAGAEPIEEFRRTVLDILKDAHQELEGNLSVVGLTGAWAGKKAEGSLPQEPRTPCPRERQPIPSTPGLVGRPMASLPQSIKLLVTPASRREFLEGQKIKFVTPVRRSERIGREKNHYPDMLKDHDPVVSSLSEILDCEEDTCFFRKNKALP
ncbi:CKP2L protein, partial [Thryothorus ludovicianus]|nr:CKP2L protein [Thryothorus ludovicianus]